MTISIEELEHAAAPGWRAAEEERLGDWLLRAAGGFTGRANSALAAGQPGLPLASAVDAVRRWYDRRGLPPMISVPFPAGGPDGSELDQLLQRLGWQIRADAAVVMTASAAAVAARGGPEAGAADLRSEPDAAWLSRYHYRGQDLPPGALQVLTSAPWQAFGSIRSAGRTVAIGRVAAAGDWAGLTAIEVDPEFRGRGLGAAITAALAAGAARRGAGQLYLQVTVGNAAARSLYRKLGFADHHQYHYRIAPAGPAAGPASGSGAQ
jgi:ribosomal protein S18 acetylase RimI-like enzyme